MKKFLKIMFSIALTLSMMFQQMNTINAYDETTPREFTRIKNISYPSWWSEKIDSVKSWSTYMCKYNGKYAYCLESSKNTPPTGQFAAEIIENNIAVKKLLYYGYGGPGYNKNIEKMYKEQLNLCVPDDFGEKYGNFADGAYLFTHIWLSYAYSGDIKGISIEEFNRQWPNADGKGGYGDNLFWGYRILTEMPDPDYAKFVPGTNNGKTADLKAVYDEKNNEQITNIVKFEANETASVHLQLQENVTLHNVTTGNNQKGGKVTIQGGQSFYLTAPLNNAPEDYMSQNIAGDNCGIFVALAIKTGGSQNQAEGTWDMDPDTADLYYHVDWLEMGSLRLSKVNNISQFQKGSKFRLVSTSYSGYDKIFEVTKDENDNNELFIENLPVGHYTLTEIECEDYFAPTVATYQVTIEKNKVTKQIVVNTLRPTGTLDLTKILEEANQDAIDVSQKDITKTSYRIIAEDDIIDTVSLKKLYEKGETILLGSGKCIIDIGNEETMFSKGVELNQGIDNGDGTYSVNEHGKLELTGFPLGKYALIEVSCPQGYVLEDKKKEILFIQQDYTTTVYRQSITQINKITKTVFSKKTITGENELEGAQLSVIDKENNVVDQWVSSNKAHEIDGLKVGETYTLIENIAPVGFVKASKIPFTVNQEGSIKKIEMVDKTVSFTKTDVTGKKEIEGAIIEVKEKSTNKVVDQWISTRKKHYIQGLEEGKTYVLTEIRAPQGYVKAKAIQFDVSRDKINQKIVMKDKAVQITKNDVNGESIIGAKMQILDTNGQVIDEWITNHQAHLASSLEEGKTYILHEDRSSNGYNVAQDLKFTVSYDKKDQSIEMTDTMTMVFKTDENGQYLKGAKLEVVDLKTKQVVDSWISGQHLFDMTDQIRIELETHNKVNGILEENDSFVIYEITKNGDRDDYTLMLKTNEKVNYYHIDLNGNETAHLVQGLFSLQTYILREISAPQGYARAKEQKFTVLSDQNITLSITNKMTKVIFHKQDMISKKALAGAKLTVIEKETGKVIDEWISTEDEHVIYGLEIDKTYLMVEKAAPENYHKAKDIEFRVEDKDEMHIYMYDKRKEVIKTGDHTYLSGYVLALLGSLIMVIGNVYFVKKKINV
ncbi:MAG: SpaA isopeptide-forming pilin-related protein [Faecalibacillus sp.]